MISLKLKNEQRVLNAFRNAPDLFAKEMQKVMQKVSVFTVGEVKMVITSGTRMFRPPIKTGALRRGIQIREVKPMRAVIIPASSTPYAKYVHEGTKRMKARPFFNITVEEKQKKVQEFFKKELNNIVDKIAKSI